MPFEPDGRRLEPVQAGNGNEAGLRAEASIKDKQKCAHVQTVTKNQYVLEEAVLHRIWQLPSAEVALRG